MRSSSPPGGKPNQSVSSSCIESDTGAREQCRPEYGAPIVGGGFERCRWNTNDAGRDSLNSERIHERFEVGTPARGPFSDTDHRIGEARTRMLEQRQQIVTQTSAQELRGRIGRIIHEWQLFSMRPCGDFGSRHCKPRPHHQ